MRIVMQANGGEMQTIKVCSIRLKLDLHLIVKSDVSHDKRFDAYKKNVHNKWFVWMVMLSFFRIYLKRNHT
jgi:hypothetical protein